MSSYWSCKCGRENEWFEDECLSCGKGHYTPYDPKTDEARQIVREIEERMQRLGALLGPKPQPQAYPADIPW